MDENLVEDLLTEPGFGHTDPFADDLDSEDAVPLRGFRRRWLKRSWSDDEGEMPVESVSYQQSSAVPVDFDAPAPEVESRATEMDHTLAVNNAFLTGMKPSTITMPWEQPWLAPIFGDPYAAPSLAMPPNWNVQFVDPTVDVLPGIAPAVPVPVTFTVSKFIKNKVDRSFIEERSFQTGKAVAKLMCFLELGLQHSGVGRQLDAETTEEGQKDVLLAILGTRSPGTVIKRVNSLLHFYRWHCVGSSEDILPLKEESVWSYVRHLQLSKAAPSKAMAFVQALRFSHYVLQVDGSEACISSRRLVGSAELQLATKGPTKQARALTVVEVRRLHAITTSAKADLHQKLMAIHLLLMLYTRSRTSDLAHVHEISHDVSSKEGGPATPGFIQISTRYHKSARNVEKKNLLLPILASSTSVVEDEWLVTWLKLRKKAGLKVAGLFNGAIQPAPDLNKSGEWLSRPLTCSETTMILRALLQCEDKDLTSHSLKTTCLSWAAKAEMPREQRRLLGRHASALQDADSVYARDLAFAPVKALQRVLLLIKDGEFDPDQNRSNFFRSGNPLAPGTPAPMFQPGTPAFLSAEVVSRPATAQHDLEEVERDEEEFSLVGAKTEESDAGDRAEEHPAEIVVSSSSESPSSTSGSEDVNSDDEKDYEVETGAPSAMSLLQTAVTDAFVRNGTTGTVHAVPGVGDRVSQSVYANGELLQRRTTRCGRMTSSGFTIVHTISDWTAKCRICFRGCREPPGFHPFH